MPPALPFRTTPQSSLLNTTLPRPQFKPTSLPQTPNTSRSFSATTTRPATLIRRPKRPYTFTQLITLSDGSTFTHRTTSPLAVYKSAKDVRNTPLWNPSNVKMAGVEEDEAGKLRAFRQRFGRGWDAKEVVDEEEAKDGETEVVAGGEGGEASEEGIGRRGRDEEGKVLSKSGWSDEGEDNLMDLIGSFSTDEEKKGEIGGGASTRPARGGKGKKR